MTAQPAELMAELAPKPYSTTGYTAALIRPVQWLWNGFLPIGKPATLVGKGEAGKGTTVAWIAARVSRGEFDGVYSGEPRKTLIVGDEDGFHDTWVPRFIAAGGERQMLRALDADIADIGDPEVQARLAATLADDFGLVVFDQLLDNIDGGRNGADIYNPKQIRRALRATGKIADHAGVAALSVLHPIKGQQQTFRDLVGGSHQFTDAARSCLFLTVDPNSEAGTGRWLGRAKGNLSARPTSQTFRITGSEFTLEGHDFDMPIAVGWQDDSRTVDDLLASRASPVRDDLGTQLEPLLTDEWQWRHELFAQLGRDPKDSTAKAALDQLVREGKAETQQHKGKGVQVRRAAPQPQI